jgi:hypothetical protein
MTKTLCVLGLSSLLLTGISAGSFAANESGDSQTVTGTHLANPQTARPATGGGSYGMSTTGTAYAPQTNVPASPDATRPEMPLANSNESSGGGAGGGAR